MAEDEALTEEEDLKPKLAANIEKARIAMARLEEIFKDNPTLQTAGVMKQVHWYTGTLVHILSLNFPK